MYDWQNFRIIFILNKLLLNNYFMNEIIFNIFFFVNSNIVYIFENIYWYIII